uniref:BTB domain-containing protein n=1 Tax=Panagrolaimus sp. PS1159 TaxID=55785 RepID=A0AC35GHZ0_9BILA
MNSNLFPFEFHINVNEKDFKISERTYYYSESFFVDGLELKCFLQRKSGILITTFFLKFGAQTENCFNGKFAFYNKSAGFELFGENKFQKTKDSWNQPLFDFNNIKKYIENEKFTLQIKGFFEKPLKEKFRQSTLGSFLWVREDRDFTIAVGKKHEPKIVIKVHKLILASRSPVFDRMIKTEMKEKAENKLEIIDFNAEIVKIAVEYFYDRETYKTCNVDQLIDLLQFADKYDIQDLKSKIENILIKNLRLTNFCQITNAAFIANSSKLKNICDFLAPTKNKLKIFNVFSNMF